MEALKQAYRTGDLHHAYLIEGDFGQTEEKILQLIEGDMGIVVRGNPDVHVRVYESFGIDDGREIQGLESKKSVGKEGKKFFILSLPSMTREAQNALLKMFEEPTVGTHFFVITPSQSTMLPTLLSRMQVIVEGNTQTNETSAKAFLTSTPSKRMELVKDIIEAKDKTEAVLLLNSIEQYLYANNNLATLSEEMRRGFDALSTVRNYITDRSSSVKMLLEYVAVSLPVIKA